MNAYLENSLYQNIAELVREAREAEIPALYPRKDVIDELPKPAMFNLVHIITGIRRCGKTFYAFQLMQKLIESGVSRDKIFYFNFADDRLKPARADLLTQIVEEYWRQVACAKDDGCYLFFDEIQEMDNWQGFCQRIAEHEKATLVITGSSSKLSADEIATTFRGRSFEHPMLPLSFREYCAFHQVAVPSCQDVQLGPVPAKKRLILESLFDDFLVHGGFPGIQNLNAGSQVQMLQAYLRDVIARDVVEKNGTVDMELATQVALYALRNTACELSINNLTNTLKKLGYRTSWEAIHKVLHLFEQAHLIDLVPEYSVSLAKSATTLPKVFSIDQGMAYAVSRSNQQDVGKRLETAVYIELKRRSFGSRLETITSYTVPNNRRQKVDFLVGDALGSEPYALYQVCANMSDEKTYAREIGSLKAAMESAHVSNGLVVTLREDDTLETEYGEIRVVPAWKWMLSEKC